MQKAELICAYIVTLELMLTRCTGYCK